jgi:uncharacterized membrane protein YkoI
MKYTFLPIALFLAAGLLSSASHASPSMAFSKIQLAQAGGQSLSAAAQSIKQRTGGRILSTKTVNKNGQRVYKIKVLLPSGKVQTFTVNAQ